MNPRIILFLLFLVFAGACSSGKKAYQKGNYDEATLKAINRLRSSPGNKKATETLYSAYNQSLAWHQQNVANAKLTQDPFKWERIADDYAQVNFLNEQIRTCPSCMSIVTNPKRFTTELEEAKLKAAEIRYDKGMDLLDTKSGRLSARQAYDHFYVANKYVPGFEDVIDLMEEAKYYATLKIVVERIPLHSRSLSLSNEFFENKIQEFLHQMPSNEFVRFYTPEEAKANGLKEVDQILILQFDDFAVGQTFIKEKEMEVSKDSVIVGTVMVEGKKQNVYNTVKAKMRIYEKNLLSQGILDLRIIDPRTNKVLTQEKLPGSFVWATQWGSFNGDERALTDEQKNICTLKEVPPPHPQDLFVAFTQPIYGQITSKIRDFYRQY